MLGINNTIKCLNMLNNMVFTSISMACFIFSAASDLRLLRPPAAASASAAAAAAAAAAKYESRRKFFDAGDQNSKFVFLAYFSSKTILFCKFR